MAQPPASLPPGFRFRPTDGELVLHYLRRRALGRPLPSAVIPDVDLLRHNPWDLLLPAAGEEEERYLFNYREAKYGNGGRANRATPGGYWKATGKEKAVAAAEAARGGGRGAVVGMKRSLVFYRGKPPGGERTDWVMHEYRLAGACLAAGSPQNAAASVPPAEGWVLCRIFKKKRGSPSNAEGVEEAQHEAEDAGNAGVRFIDFLGPARPAWRRPASPASSCVTDASSAHCAGEEETSRGK